MRIQKRRTGKVDILEGKAGVCHWSDDSMLGGTFLRLLNEGSPTDSGPVRSDAECREYHYEIEGLNSKPGAKAADPKVIIKP